MKNIPNDQIFCKCGAEMIVENHIEDDGDRGSYEPHAYCPDGCLEEEA